MIGGACNRLSSREWVEKTGLETKHAKTYIQKTEEKERDSEVKEKGGSFIVEKHLGFGVRQMELV